MLSSTPISAIVPGKLDFQVRVRVIHLWIVPDRMKPTEDGTIQMLFLDDKCHKIEATVRKDLIPKYMDQLEEGSAYVFEKFMVGSKDAFYKSIGHKYKLNFMTSTTVFKVTAPEIPRYHFDFVPFSEILNATDESRLVDVIGHVVEKGVVKETIVKGKKSKVTNLTLKDLENNRLHCSLWNDFAVRFHQFMDTHNSSEPPVMILELVRLKKNSYLGVMGVINIFNGTKMLLNADIPDVAV
ncbi:replication protein A 70 kDa DNA-binding subunit [Trifolium repens]|nr:replication protein A 70 kDa DNA-binding subunit [Trifolium repens]